MSRFYSPFYDGLGYFNYVRKREGIISALDYELSRFEEGIENISDKFKALVVVGGILFYEKFVETKYVREKESKLTREN